jgi:hypothetical protein
VLDDAAPKFIWGDTVIVSAQAPSYMRPGEVGDVVAITHRATETTYTLEFGDGQDAELPESFLSGDACGRFHFRADRTIGRGRSTA